VKKKVNIIGAGLAGLSAGIYLQQEGVETEIFEIAGWAGGMCTAWVRNGYRFDGCIHWMVGTKPGDDFYKLYCEVGALEEDTVIYNAESIKVEISGEMYEVPMKIDQFRQFLHSLSEQDSAKIEELCGIIEVVMHDKMPSGAPSNLSDLIRIIKESRGFLNIARKYTNVTVKEYAERFQSPTLRSFLYMLMPQDFSSVALFMMLGTRMSGNAGYPMGGAWEVIRRMESKYRSLGGKIRFNTKVDEIVVENGRATGVRAKGVLYPSDGVIAACDAYDTLKRMLGGKYAHPQLDTMLRSSPLFSSLAVISFGLNRKFGIPYSVMYEYKKGIKTSPDTVEHGFSLRSFDFDPSAAPENGSSVMVMTEAPLDYWKNLRDSDIDGYRKQKQQLADDVADAIEERIPELKDAIAVIDVATPATYARLANLYQGSVEGFTPIPAALKTMIRKTVPGIKALCLCGQWTSAGGGICTAVSGGKEAAYSIMKKI
jgi:Phytoene dehydrogenase and related proteins